MEKTEEIYYEDVHQTEFTAVVLSCVPDSVPGTFQAVLNRTAFFPEQGGQSADRGTLGGARVLDVQIRDGVIRHRIDRPLTPGSRVDGSVDAARRFDFMQQHTGEHMVSGIAHRLFGVNNVGFHLGEVETQVDLDGPLTAEDVRRIEEEANRAVWKDIPVKCWFPPADILKTLDYRSKIDLTQGVRIVSIPGVDECACCAPHADSTGQVGVIKVLDRISYKGGVRMHLACGERALRDYCGKQDRGEKISNLLSAPQGEIDAAVEKLKKRESELEGKISALTGRLLEEEASALPSPEVSADAFLFTEGADQNTMRRLVNRLMERYPGYSGIFSGNSAAGYRFILGSRNRDCAAAAVILRKKGFKCGGQPGFIQGGTGLGEEEIRAVLETLPAA